MKGYSGRYKYDKELGKMVKISDSLPNVQVFDCFCPDGGYWSNNISDKPVYIESRAHKRQLLAKENLREKGTTSRREL